MVFTRPQKLAASGPGDTQRCWVLGSEALLNMLEQEEIGLKTKTIYEIDYLFFEPYMPKDKGEQSD